MQFLTVSEPRRERYHVSVQRGGRGFYFDDFEYELTPDPMAEALAVGFNPNLGRYLPHEFWPAVEDGASRLGVSRAHMAGRRLCCTRFTLMYAKYHEVDTSPLGVRVRIMACVDTDVADRLAKPITPLHRDWLTSDVVALARGIAASGAPDGLPALTDALLEAGCDHPLAMEHLRTCPDHGPSCWVVEMICAQASGS